MPPFKQNHISKNSHEAPLHSYANFFIDLDSARRELLGKKCLKKKNQLLHRLWSAGVGSPNWSLSKKKP